ncbi:hypothetical protein [Micromonospora sp. NPDC005206]|uniref:hypothetical protein n=1 Tax=Micromonospora sp. NPDC005206 TaxID=3157022 RepID=UPI0033AC06EB
MCAARLGDLHGEVADAARGRVNQYALARLDVGDIDQGLPRGEPGEPQTGRLDVGQPGGLASEVPRRCRDVLCVGAGRPR